MSRCAPTLRSFAAASCLGVVLVASVAGCGGRGDVDADRLSELVTTTLRPAATVTTTVAPPTLVVTEPPTSAAAPDLDEQLSSIDAELRELDAALKDFDQITATTEGDPSK